MDFNRLQASTGRVQIAADKELLDLRPKDDSVSAELEQINRHLEGVLSRMSARRDPAKWDAPSRSGAMAYGSRT